MAKWHGINLKEAQNFQNIDVLVLAINYGQSRELENVLDADCGIMNYVKNFWQGFYPLLLVEITSTLKTHQDDDDTKVRILLFLLANSRGYFFWAIQTFKND